jgi:hypothetical protein
MRIRSGEVIHRDAAHRLSKESRASLARELLASWDDRSGSEIEELWLLEAVRRDNDEADFYDIAGVNPGSVFIDEVQRTIKKSASFQKQRQ